MQNNRSKGKKGNNEGTIFRWKDGRWAATVSLGGGRASQKRKTVYGRTRADVASKLTRVLKAVQDGVPLPSGQLTVAAFAQEWLRAIKPSLKPKTWSGYESALRVHLLPSIGKITLGKLDARHLEALYAGITEKGLSARSVRNYHARLHTMLTRAVRLGLISRNVSSFVELPRQSHKETPMLTAAEVRVFLMEAQKSRLEALFAIAITSGPRQSELLGLSWDDVDLKSGELRINRALQRVDGKFV